MNIQVGIPMKWSITHLFSRLGQQTGHGARPHYGSAEREVAPDSIEDAGENISGTNAQCDLDRKLAGILYADIANYARLTEQDEEGTHLLMMQAIEAIISHIADHNGRIAHRAGDAILAEFEDADSALHCAINAQLEARQWNADLPFDKQVLFRMGVNFGDVISERGDIYGNAVNLAARLEQLASSGGICVSESVRKALGDHPSFKFVAMGRQRVKNISEPVQAFWIEFDNPQFVDAEFTGLIKVSPLAP